MPTFNSIIFNTSKNIRSYDLEDIRIIIDQISIPILITNAESLKVISANNLFCQESKYSHDELVEMHIAQIISGIEDLNQSDGLTKLGELEKKNKKIIPCNYSIKLFGRTKKLAIIFIDLIKEDKEKEIHLLKSLIEHFLQIYEQVFSPEFISFENEIIKNVVDVFNPSGAAYYSKGNQGDYLCIEAMGEIFLPEKMPGIEFGNLENQDIWTPGKRVYNSIHRAGRLHNIPLIIATPILFKPDSQNLIVLTFNDSLHEDILSKYINVFCKIAKHYFHANQISMENTKFISTVNQTEAQLKLIFENIRDGGIVYDQSGRIVRANQSALDLLGYDLSEIQKVLIKDIFSDEKILNFLFASESLQLDMQKPVIIHNRDGSKIPVTIALYNFLIEEKRFFLILINDIRESIDQMNAMAGLEKKAILGDMVADFAHEVRNPINNISTGLQLVKSRLSIEDSNLVVVERMLNDCIRMNHLMDSILSFSRHKFSEFEQLNINLLLQKITARFIEKAKIQNITISKIDEKENLIIPGDARALEQVFINIISNAIEALENKGGVISIKTYIDEQKPNMVQIAISDTGPGIPEELQPQIFEPFVSNKPKGTGLGLAITKRIIDAHNGTISFDTFTTGTIISISFPMFIQGDLR